MRRQSWRKALIFISFLLFPLTIYYFSPMLIIMGAAEGIVATSLLVFTAMFIFSLVFGRLFCGWVCPAGGLQEASFMINKKAARGGKANWIKYFIWVPWLLLILLFFIRAGDIRQIDPLYHIPGGISVSQPGDYIIYLFIVGLIFILSLTAGKRAFCHYVCWMAPFMIIGTKLKSARLWPSLGLTAVSDTCNNCKRCNKECPMSLDINALVNSGIENNPECILCAACIDVCPQSVLRMSFSRASVQQNSILGRGKAMNNKQNLPDTDRRRADGIGSLARQAYYMMGCKGLHGVSLLIAAAVRLLRANRRRRQFSAKHNLDIPTVLVVSVTMVCNYDCLGCYSRGRPDKGELSKAELSNLFNEAQDMGLLAAVLTGGEPLMRDDLLEIVEKQKQILFIMITNGSLMTPEKAAAIGRMRNLVVLVSIEGSSTFTDGRRGEGAHRAVLKAMAMLKGVGAFFGFAATNNSQNNSFLSSDEFIDEMIERGCSAGLITEYVPCGQEPRSEWVLNAIQREQFRQRILEMRSVKPIVLVQFPQDEYGEANICSGAGRISLHINAQGGIEPCPFVPLSCDNIRQGGLMAAVKSPFLASIRSRPNLLARDRLACSLYEHFSEVEALLGHSNKADASTSRWENRLVSEKVADDRT